MSDHDPFEERLRSGFDARADDVDVSAPVVRRAQEAACRRTRGRTGAAIAAVLVVVGAGVVLAQRTGDVAPVADRASDPPSQGADERTWRTEYWGRISVEVPADWGYGGAPVARGALGDELACYPQAVKNADGDFSRGRERSSGYVGRPIAVTDVCTGYPVEGAEATSQPYVWLGASVEPGSIDLRAGFVQETVDVLGTTVTVGSEDAALRARILDSVAEADLCRSEVGGGDDELSIALPPGPVSEAETLTVCAYRSGDPIARAPASLTYGIRLGADAVRDYLSALEAGEEPRDQCPAADIVESEWVVLELADSEGTVLRRDVAHFVCPGIDVAAADLRGFETVRMTPAMVEPWAVAGVPATVYGPNGGKGAMLESFIGQLG